MLCLFNDYCIYFKKVFFFIGVEVIYCYVISKDGVKVDFVGEVWVERLVKVVVFVGVKYIVYNSLGIVCINFGKIYVFKCFVIVYKNVLFGNCNVVIYWEMIIWFNV